MRPWRVRLAGRRSRVQWALLAVVLVVSTLAATMLTSLYLLSTATERFAARAALTNADPATIELRHRIEPRREIEGIITASSEAATELFGVVPYTQRVQVQGELERIDRGDERRYALSYVTYADRIEEEGTLQAGAWPDASAPATAPTPAAIPSQLAKDMGLQVGDEFTLGPILQRGDARPILVVGIFDPREPGGDYWSTDRFNGEGYNEQTPVPFTGGTVTAEGFGPIIVPRQAAVRAEVDVINAFYAPDFSETSLSDVESIIGRVEGADLAATRAIGGGARTVTAATEMDETLGGVLGALAVTRSSVLVTGLLLLVLAVAALAQTARLMAERRHGEQLLMQARGAGRSQLLWLGTLDATALALITTALGPPLALRVYGIISSQPAMVRAGMNQDPGVDALSWAVAGVVGFALLVVLVLPLMRKSGTFIEGEQARSRPGKRAAFQRSGLDVALLALAALAYWQLRSYESPVVTSGGVARLDPLLAAGPALALLAGALVCVRLIPAAGRLMEGIAARGRGAVGPLAAWEVGRRSARAVSAILLLTLAVSVGTFAVSFLRTWQTSQDDQAEVLHPAGAKVAGIEAEVFAQASYLEHDGVTVSPAFAKDGQISAQTTVGQSRFGSAAAVSGPEIKILGLGDAAMEQLRTGRVGIEVGDDIATALSPQETQPITPIELPGSPSGVAFDVDAYSSETELEGLTMALRVIVEDGNGLITTVDAGLHRVDDAVYDADEDEARPVTSVVVPFADAASIGRLTPPLKLVGIQTSWFVITDQRDPIAVQTEGDMDIDLSIANVEALTRVQDYPVEGVEPRYDRVAAILPADPTWYGTSSGATPDSLRPLGDAIHIRVGVRPATFLFRTVSITANAYPVQPELPVVMSRGLLKKLGIEDGDAARIGISGVGVLVRVVGVTPYMPGENPRENSVIANFDELQRAVVQNGAPPPPPTEWWLDIDPSARGYVEALGDTYDVSTQLGVATSLREDPLRAGTQAALWLVAAAAALLAAVGFAVHSVVTVRAREIEFAQLRAVGIRRDSLVRLAGTESFLLSLLGAVFGVSVGLALAYLVGPLVSVGTDGRPPLPSVIVDIPWQAVGLLAAEVAVVLLLSVTFIAFLLRRIDPAQMLRQGD